MRFAIYTLGCKVNQYESQAMQSILEGEGHTAVPFEEEAELYIINTCSVTAVSDKKSRQVIRRVRHPAFGYFEPSEDYYNAILRWQAKRNGVTGLEKKHIGYENGVLGGVVSTLNVLCSRGGSVLLQSPAYIGFTHVLENNGFRIVHNPLVQDGAGVWRMDYEDMERKIVENGVHAAIFCNPHNPCGRVWEPGEIRRAMEIFEKHRVWVVSAPPSPSANMPAPTPRLSTPPPKPSTWRAWWEAIILFMTTGCGSGRPRKPPSAPIIP